jgi:hypothetical protein
LVTYSVHQLVEGSWLREREKHVDAMCDEPSGTSSALDDVAVELADKSFRFFVNGGDAVGFDDATLSITIDNVVPPTNIDIPFRAATALDLHDDPTGDIEAMRRPTPPRYWLMTRPNITY